MYFAKPGHHSGHSGNPSSSPSPSPSLEKEGREGGRLMGVEFNPLSANPSKWSITLKKFVGKLLKNCLSALDHFVGLNG